MNRTELITQLIIDYKVGRATFEQVEEVMRPSIRRIACRAVNFLERLKPMYDYSDFENLMRVALLKALNRFDVVGEASFITYFEQWAQREINTLRRLEGAAKRAGNYNKVEYKPDLGDEFMGGNSEIEGGFERVEFYDALQSVRLTPNETVICAGKLNGLRNREIARANGWTEQYVSQALKRMRGKFARAGLVNDT